MSLPSKSQLPSQRRAFNDPTQPRLQELRFQTYQEIQLFIKEARTLSDIDKK